MEFTETQITRYSRHILLPEVGGKGQKKIVQAKMLLVGAGGLGSPAALYLAAAGIGTIGLIDSDVVDLTNLQRQVLHHTADVGRSKVLSGQRKNPGAQSRRQRGRCTKSGSRPAMPSRLSQSTMWSSTGSTTSPRSSSSTTPVSLPDKPLVHGGILRFDGRVTTIIPEKSACYRCVFKTPPPPGLVASCQEAGVIGVLAGIIGTIQATEALETGPWYRSAA